MLIRGEAPADFPAVRTVLERAFPLPAEARLVDELRADGDVVVAGVAVDRDLIVGHVMVSRMAAPFRALGLGPVAVLAAWQRRGTGSDLIRWALERAEDGGWQGVFVLGDPGFYQRFGFDPVLAAGFTSPYAGPHLMVLALGGPLPAATGRVDYAPAFGSLG